MIESTRRRGARTAVDWIAVIRLDNGSEIACSVKDVSATGMRVCLPQDHALPPTFMLRVIGRPLVFRVRQAWRRVHQLGVEIETIAKLATPAQAAEDGEGAAAAHDRHSRLGTRSRYGT